MLCSRVRAHFQRRIESRPVFIRPPLPIALLLGYAWIERSRERRVGWQIVRELDERDWIQDVAVSTQDPIDWDGAEIIIPI